jgi:hypothetical protein
MLTVLRHNSERMPLTNCRLATARSCFALLADRYKPDVVLMPALAPQGLIEPFRRARFGAFRWRSSQISFYRLNENLTPDITSLGEELWNAGANRPLVVVIPYCGYDTPLADAAEVVHDACGLLLADCAQALVGPSAFAREADVVVYSIDKFLPTIGGGIMISRHPAADIWLKTTNVRPMPIKAQIAYARHIDANTRVSHAKNSDGVAKHLADSAKAYDEYYKIITADMSPRLMPAETFDRYNDCSFSALAANRIARANAWPYDLNRFLWREGTPTFALPIKTFGRRQEVFEALVGVGVIPSQWSEKWNRPDPIRFPVEANFMNDHFLLPINGEVTPDDVRVMANVLECAVS